MHQRLFAAIAATLVVVANVVALHHGTEVAHVRDGAGEHQHAHELAERHEASAAPHLHGRDVEAHTDAGCALLASLERASLAARSFHPQVVVVAAVVPETVVASRAPEPVAILHVAPKTSPPAIG